MSQVPNEERLQALFSDPGSAISRAVDFGIDLSLTFRRMRLSPEERLAEAERTLLHAEAMRETPARAIGPI